MDSTSERGHVIDMTPPAHEPAASTMTDPRSWPVHELVEDLRTAFVSRAINDREISLQKQSRVFFQVSGAGHETLLLALARYLRVGYDWFYPYYRDQALMLGLGETPEQIFLASTGSADDPSSGGRQMPSHWGFPNSHVMTVSSATGSQCIPAVGCAEATTYFTHHRDIAPEDFHEDEVTVVALGDGACSQGEFWEAINAACMLRLPLLFLIEDNGWAISVATEEQTPAPVSQLVSSWPDLKIIEVDGCDYFSCRSEFETVIAQLRAGNGPYLVHAKVTRPYAHSSADVQTKYQTPDEIVTELEADPIKRFAKSLVDAGVLDEDGVARLKKAAFDLVALAAQEALGARRPDPATITDHVVNLPAFEEDRSMLHGGGENVAMGEAIRRTLDEQLALDERIRVFGEDVADARPRYLDILPGKGGVFGTTSGLQRNHGSDRVFNTPLSEANIVGRAVGMGMRGLRPVPEIQFFDYIWTAMQQIKSQAATVRWRSNGAFSCPMVLRVPIGGYLTGGAIWHSQSGESIFAHVPGLTIVFPSRAQDAAGLLRTALTCEDPVLFLEHKHLLRQRYTEDPFPPASYMIPFGKGSIVQSGTDLTIVTYGAMVEKSRRAASSLALEGISVEIIDLRTIIPWDQELVMDSIARTGRALIVHEDSITCGFGAEIAAIISERGFELLDAPVRRVAAIDTHVAYEPTLEHAVLPQTDQITAAARELAKY
ncbi:MAG TPA: dehydrogenase E1 component subunit alpha/beta [Acidimicrobiales bacterium]|nr:dehydrogenase E1 component subunit alpha/beta [Acidimicrobiales bacterium]